MAKINSILIEDNLNITVPFLIPPFIEVEKVLSVVDKDGGAVSFEVVSRLENVVLIKVSSEYIGTLISFRLVYGRIFDRLENETNSQYFSKLLFEVNNISDFLRNVNTEDFRDFASGEIRYYGCLLYTSPSPRD